MGWQQVLHPHNKKPHLKDIKNMFSTLYDDLDVAVSKFWWTRDANKNR